MTDPGVRSERRYCLLKMRSAERCGLRALASLWAAKHAAEAGTALGDDFPARAKLIAAGYSALEDIAGADDSELMDAGLTRHEAAAALAAVG